MTIGIVGTRSRDSEQDFKDKTKITINKKCDNCNTIMIIKEVIPKPKKFIKHKCDNCGQTYKINIELVTELGKLNDTLNKIDNK